MMQYPQQGTANKPPFAVFLATTIMLFFLTLSSADSVGFVPDYLDDSTPSASFITGGAEPSSPGIALSDLPQLGSSADSTLSTGSGPTDESLAVSGVEPDRIRIPAIDMDLPVSNPETRDIGVLAEIIKKGPARYANSALLGEKGNVIIFGHSSQLPIVRNPMYKAFNKISELTSGDTIMIEADGTQFMYSVSSIKSINVNDGALDLSKEAQKLTLITCDVRRGEDWRFVLEADFIGVISQ